MKDFPALDSQMLRRWELVARGAGIPDSEYLEDVRVVAAHGGGFSFGVILNKRRLERPQDLELISSNCPLCEVADSVSLDGSKNLDCFNELENHFVVPNLFPAVQGHSLAISKASTCRGGEVPMYTTKDLSKFSEDMGGILTFCNRYGFQVFQNTDGAGASIPNHQHTQLINWKPAFLKAGRKYGIEDSSVERTRVSSVGRMPEFPFAHLVFQDCDPERVSNFLSSLHYELSINYERGFVPHILCQRTGGILVVPYKNYVSGGSGGSGGVAGHIIVKDRKKFESFTYQEGVCKLGKRLFTEGEIDLEKFL